MDPKLPIDVTRLLRAWGSGDPEALALLTPLVYAELHRIARLYMRREASGITLQATALVNEAYLRLVDLTGVQWQDRAHFFALSAQVMRRILVDAAKARRRAKRGGGALRFSLNESVDAMSVRAIELVALDEALDGLSRFDPRKARVVEMRYFGGLSVEETAAVLGISSQSVLRDWKIARSWLMREMSRESC